MDRERFSRLWHRCCDDGQTANPVYSEIEAGYGEPHRFYHTGRHVEHCLRQLDLARDQMEAADAIEMALWFHDVVYNPTAADNELRSAQRFEQLATGAMNPTLLNQVYRLIMITVHNAPPQAIDEKYVVDIDLSSFGLPWDEFTRDSQDVRKECTHLSDAEFTTRNHRFLRSLLDRPSIFSTEYYRDLYEQTARRNIARRIGI